MVVPMKELRFYEHGDMKIFAKQHDITYRNLSYWNRSGNYFEHNGAIYKKVADLKGFEAKTVINPSTGEKGKVIKRIEEYGQIRLVIQWSNGAKEVIQEHHLLRFYDVE